MEIPRIDLRRTDAVLVVKMAEMINAGVARGPENAAKALVEHAAGAGNAQSKVKRLLKRWAEYRRDATEHPTPKVENIIG